MQPDTSTAATSAGAQSDATVGPSGAKLTVDKFADGDIVGLRFDGSIDANFEGKKLAASLTAATLILDLGGVKKISSFGIREWVDFVKTAGEQVQQLILIECTPKVVDQLNIVGNFVGDGRVFCSMRRSTVIIAIEHRVLLHVDCDRDATSKVDEVAAARVSKL